MAWFCAPSMTSGQEMQQALFLQPGDHTGQCYEKKIAESATPQTTEQKRYEDHKQFSWKKSGHSTGSSEDDREL